MQEKHDDGDLTEHPLLSNLQSLISILRFPLSILLLTLPAWLPLLLDAGLVNTRAGGDSPFLLQRVHQMAVALRGGHFPARWMPDAAFGFGYPFWNYYAPLAYYVAAGFHLVGLGIVNAIKLTQILGFLLAGAGAYALTDDIFDSRPAAVLTAAAYTYAPFHLVNVYVRGDSLGEFVAFAFYPLIFLGLRRLRSTPGPGPAAFTAVAYAGLVLAHNISALIFTPFTLAYALLLLLTNPGDKHRTEEPNHAPRTTHHAPRSHYLLWTTLALTLGLALSAFYWAPALLEQDAVQLAGNLTGYFHYAGHFRSASLVQRDLLFNFDMDAAGTSFSVGLIQAILGFLGLLAITISLIRQKTKFTINRSQFKIQNSFFAVTALIATFLITPWSQPIWDRVPLLPFVQFPWRWLSVQAFALSLVIGSLAQLPFGKPEHAPRTTHHAPRTTHHATTIILTLLLIVTAVPSLNVEYLPVRDADVTAERLMLYETFTGNIGSTVRAEYLPAAVVPRPWTSSHLTQGEVPVPIGAGSAELLGRAPASQQWQVTVDQPRDVIFPTYWFPGWRATLDGEPAETSAQPNHGGTRVTLPAGTHQVDLVLGRTSTRLAAEIASAMGLLLLLVFLARHGLPTRAVRVTALAIAVVIIVALTLVAVSNVPLQARSGVSSPDDASLLTWDFSRMPYLHPNPAGVSFANGSRLVGYELSTTDLAGGETFDVEMTWSEETSANAEMALVSPAEVLHHVPAVVAEERAQIQRTTTLGLRVPPETTAGLYLPRLRVVADDEAVPARAPSGEEFGTLYLQPVRIRPTDVRPDQAAGSFADLASLGSATVERVSPERVEVQMTWWAEQPIAANYATSVRFKTAAGETLAQRDTQPCYGFCPTSTWEPGVPVYDRRWLEVPADVSTDDRYQIEVVLYERATLAAIDTAQVDVSLPSD